MPRPSAALTALGLAGALLLPPAQAQKPKPKPAPPARPAPKPPAPTDEALLEAFDKENWTLARTLVARGANPNAATQSGLTALGYAASSGDLKLVTALLERGARVNPTNPDHTAPLTLAFDNKNPEIARLLIQKGAAVNVGDGSSFEPRPLVLAILARWQPIVELLIAKGAEVRHKNDQGFTALAAAAQVGSVPLMQLLVDRGAPVEGDREALSWAVLGGSLPALDFLVARGRSLKEPQPDVAFLHLAALSDNPAMIQRVLETGADLEVANEDGKTSLLLAAENLKAASVAFLLSKKARVDTLSFDYRSALDLAQEAKGESAPTIAALKQAGAKPAPPSLWRAAVRKDVAELTTLLEQGADPNEADARKAVPLFYAIHDLLSSDALPLVTALLERGADPNRPAPDGATLVETARAESQDDVVALLRRSGAETPEIDLTEAIERGDAAQRDKLLARGVIPESAALAFAILSQDQALLTQLLDKGARVNAPLHRAPGDYPLHVAIDRGNLDAVRLLLDRGADPNLQKEGGNHALAHVSVGTDAEKDAMVRLLVERGARVSARAGIGTGRVLSILAGNVGAETLAFLLKSGAAADINPTTPDEDTPLKAAVLGLRLDNVRLLLDNGADPNGHRAAEVPPLLDLARFDNAREAPAIAKLLIERGAKLDAKDREGRTALRIAQEEGGAAMVALLKAAGGRATIAPEFEMLQAIREDDPATVRRLLDAGFSPNATVGKWAPALYIAAFHGNQAMAALLIQRGAEVNHKTSLGTALHAAAGSGETETVRFLIARGARLEVDGLNGTPLTDAAENDHLDTMKALLKAGADPNARRSENPGSPLVRAILRHGNPEAIELLLKSGADPNIGAPLVAAAMRQTPELVERLVKAGAKLNVADEFGSTPLIRAAQWGLPEVITWLIEHKADVNARDKKGKTALSYALAGDFQACVRLLRKAGAKP